jgi:hypothetical protein
MNNSICRKVMFLVARLHQEGHDGLRIMPTLDEDQWSVLIGPRRAFSERDGSFVPHDLRKACIKFTDAGESEILDDDPYQALKQIFLPSWAKLGSEYVDKHYSEWLNSSRLTDQEYRMWYLTLCGRLAIDDGAFPVRPDIEAPTIASAAFFLSLPKSRRWHENWNPPPVGTARSSGSLKSYPHDIAVAQPRSKDAPDLFWPSGENDHSDSNLDDWYDNNARSVQD